jgi:hypothetical protein
MCLYKNKYTIRKKINVLVLGAFRHTKQCHVCSYNDSLLDIFVEVNLIMQWEYLLFILACFLTWVDI